MSSEFEDAISELSHEIDLFNKELDKISSDIKKVESALKPIAIDVDMRFDSYILFWDVESKRLCISELFVDDEVSSITSSRPVLEYNIKVRLLVHSKLSKFMDEVKIRLKKGVKNV